MLLWYSLALVHLLALAIGIAAVYARWRALRNARGKGDLGPVFLADNWYGVATVLWLVTGLWRAFGGVEKGTEHYLGEPLFIAKLGLFGLVGALELLPMVMLVRWRSALRKSCEPDLRRAPLLARLTALELPLLVAMVAMAVALARGM